MMSHMTAALLVTLALLLTLRGAKRKSCGIAALSGLCLGLMLLARPYTALLASLVLGAYYATQLAIADSRRETLHAAWSSRHASLRSRRCSSGGICC